MGLFIQQNDSRSELQDRIAAELREKAKQTAQNDHASLDQRETSKYLDGTKRTTSLAWVWLLIIVLAISVFVVFVVRSNP